MNDTLSTPDPASQVAEVRHIITHRGDHTCEAVLLRIRRVVDPPPADAREAEVNDRGWPEMHPSDQLGTAWERHDEPDLP